MKDLKPITLSALDASRHFGVPYASLLRHLQEIGCVTKNGTKYDLKTILKAIAGDHQLERTRLARAEAALREQELAQSAGTLVTLDAAKAIVVRKLGPVRSKLMAMPSRIAAEVNPADPEMARVVLERAIDDALREAAE
jgi:hypothetical protein